MDFFTRAFANLLNLAPTPLFSLLRFIAVIWLALHTTAPVYAQVNAIHVPRASLAADDKGWALNARFEFTLNSSLKEAVKKGVPLYFTTYFELARKRWYWFDQQTVASAQSIRLSYQPLTRQYRVWSGGLQLGLPSLDDALTVVKNVHAWHVIDHGAVKPGSTYTASVRMQLNTALMPKPFQINALSNRDWSLSSAWKRFIFTPFDDAK